MKPVFVVFFFVFFYNPFSLVSKFPINNPSFVSSKPGFSQINMSIVRAKTSFSLVNPVLLQDYRFSVMLSTLGKNFSRRHFKI